MSSPTAGDESERIRREVQRFHLSKTSILGAVPEFREHYERLRAGDISAVGWGVAILEADPYHFRSGYLKSDISRWLRRVPLSELQKDRLRAAILNTLPKGGGLEFGETRRLARRLDSPRFRKQIEKFLTHPDPGTMERARLLLESCRLNETRGDLRGAR